MQKIVLDSMTFQEFWVKIEKVVGEAVKIQLTPKISASHTDLPEYLTRKQAAKVLNISVTSLDYIVKEGRLLKYRNGRFVRFKKEEVLNFYKTFSKYKRGVK